MKSDYLREYKRSYGRHYIPSLGELRETRFLVDYSNSGLSLLPEPYVASTQLPVFAHYDASDASAAQWVARTGETLPVVNVGADVVTGRDTPLLDASPAVKFSAADHFASSGTTYGDVTTEDIYWEIFGYFDAGKTAALFSKRTNPNAGYVVHHVSSAIYFRIDDGTNVAQAQGTLTTGWQFLSGFVNRDEASTNGMALYSNGVQLQAADPSAVVSCSNSETFKIGAQGTTYADGDEIAHLLVAKGADMWAAGATGKAQFAALTAQRFAMLTGIWPQIAKGTSAPVVATRSTAAYLDRVVSGGRKLFCVAPNWIRCEQNATAAGLLRERAATNLSQRSQEFDNGYWAKTNTTVTPDATTAPDGTSTADAINENSDTAQQHIVGSTVTSPTNAAYYTWSIWAKAINRTKILLLNASGAPTCSARFELTGAGVIDAPASTFAQGIQAYSDGSYRCWITWLTTSTATLRQRVYILNDAGAATYDGLGQAAVYLWGGQVEQRIYPSSYVPTLVSASATRTADALYYKGDDGNLGGTGSLKRGRLTSVFWLPSYETDSSKVLSVNLLAALNDGGSTADAISIAAATTDGWFASVVAATATSALVGPAIADARDGAVHSSRLDWRLSRVSLAVDGGSESVAAPSAGIPDDLDRITIGARATDADDFGPGLIRNLKIEV